MRSLALLLCLPYGCQFGTECAPGLVAHETAAYSGKRVHVCGEADGNATLNGTSTIGPEEVFECAALAHMRRQAFTALWSPPSADGGSVTGFASDGERVFRVHHKFASNALFFGGDSECFDAQECLVMIQRPDCTGYKDCLVCIQPQAVRYADCSAGPLQGEPPIRR